MPSRPLTNFDESLDCVITLWIPRYSFQNIMMFRHCLSPFRSNNQVVKGCMGLLLLKSPWFLFTHTETSGGASIAPGNKCIKIWFVSSSFGSICVFKNFCHSPEGFIKLLKRGPREHEVRHLQWITQRPDYFDLYPHLLAHAVLTLDTVSQTFLSRWDAATDAT